MANTFENLSNIEDYDDIPWWVNYKEDIEDYDQKPWWVDYDGDIEEERRKIEERVREIEDPEERETKYEELLDNLEYKEYYAYNPHLKSESYLINLRLGLRSYEDEDNKEFFCHILEYSNMVNCSGYSVENVLIMNKNKKITFLNSTKTFLVNEIIEKGYAKMRREYGNEWTQDDERSKGELIQIGEWSEDDEESCTFVEFVRLK